MDGLIDGINHVIAYGQSLSSGWEGWPPVTTDPPTDALMLGDCVRPAEEASPSWRPVGDARFRPLVARVQRIVGGALLDAADLPGLRDPAPVMGETPLEAAVHGLRAALLPDHPGKRLLASSCGVGGRSMEALSRGADPDLFQRIAGCIACARAEARRAGEAYRLAALLLVQGENNSWGSGGATDDAGAYRSLLRRWHADVAALVAPDTPPAVFTYQTGGTYASQSLSIAQAQLDHAAETPGWTLAAPVSMLPDKGGHLTADGYNLLGRYFARSMAARLVHGRAWQPLHITEAVRHARWIALRCSVPTPPLRWSPPFVGAVRADIPDRGFAVRDADGDVPIESVDITDGTTFLITLARAPSGSATLRYAAAGRTLGRGMLRDSADPPNWCAATVLGLR